MPQTKIVFFDIDGTLIDMQAKKITPKMLETLHRLQDRGIKICIATGRSPMVLPKIDGVAFDAYLTFNGSLCYDRKGVIFSNPIPHKDVVRFIQNAAALGRPVCVSTRGRLAANGTDTDLTDYFFIANEPVPVADDFDAVCAEDIYQLMLGCRPKDYPALLDGAPGRRSPPGGTARWMSSPRAAARASALKKCWPITGWTRPKPWPLATATTTRKCCRLWAPA